MANFDKAMFELIPESDWSNYNGYAGEAPSSEAEYDALKIDNKHLEIGIKDDVTPMFASSFTPPTWAEIQAQMGVEEARGARALEYPSIQEQLDMQYWDSVNGTTTWADAIAAVKAANPKPE